MGFQVAPGVNFSEIDLTTIVPAVSTTEGAIAGVFRWGPLDKLILVDNEDTLVKRFGKPTNNNFETFFSAANFLAYGNKLFVSRAGETTNANTSLNVQSAVATFNADPFTNTATDVVESYALHLVKNEDDYELKDGTFETEATYIARYPGELGNSLKISVCDSNAQYSSVINLKEETEANNIGTKIAFISGSNTAVVYVANNAGSDESDTEVVANNIRSKLSVGDLVIGGNSSVGTQFLKITGVSDNLTANVGGANTGVVQFTLSFEDPYTLVTNVESTSISRTWEYFNVVNRAPTQTDYVALYGNTSAQDALHVVISDEDGKITGVPGTILEVFENLSRATDAKTEDGSTNYYKTVINQNSNYVWFANDRAGSPSETADLVTTSTNTRPLNASFVGGQDGASESLVSVAALVEAYELFTNQAEVDISLVIAGKARGGVNGEQLGNWLVDNLAEKRRDCVVFISPDRADVVSNPGKDYVNDIVQFRNSLRSSSYQFIDSGYKYQYDKYSDTYRYVPLNGDIAGLAVRTDVTRDAWWSIAGYNRGQIKNIVRLAWNPSEAEIGELYKNGVNSVVAEPGQGIILKGDKTGLSKPSAFDRINVRRLFIVLEKAISTAAKFTLFEFNDEFTRAQFKNLVEPFLRDVQGRRGIQDFRVVCDETNNTGEVIDRNEFVGDIYIKPSRSINYIQLNFVAVRSGVAFEEVVGKF